ncbi:hypothetical protein C2I18_16455 [Paenibacillus sp. PK3_47]|uniref:hypothetical protein n=1 Tax=Paenibacillus sp. PK3_47 TaxID=2072642 RepID=UPI00201E39EB|nr:hypothetical protein [Paenibacillus sp. PK3_47]UQZ34972.1 hypothetical protein C2I18_16455 [Paenibacillus sp. PK3_47]
MTWGSVLILILNAAYCLIMPCFLFHAYKQYKFKKAGKNQIQVYDPALFIPHSGLLVTAFLYLITVTVLWMLYIFGVSDLLISHWFYYVYLAALPAVINHDRVLMHIGKQGIVLNKELIPWDEITRCEFKGLNPATNRWKLEIQAGDRGLCGIISSGSFAELDHLLEKNKCASTITVPELFST